MTNDSIDGVKISFDEYYSKKSDSIYNKSNDLHNACRYSLAGQGKRVRPMLLLLSRLACAGKITEQDLDAATALEFIHTYSLIHDDLPCMDDDAERRGRPTVHIEFDEATALLAGDALLSDSFHLLLGETPSVHQALAASHISKAIGGLGMVLGQNRDMYWTGRQGATLDDLREIHSLKTGNLIAAACAAGAILGGSTPEKTQAFQEFGEKIGFVFQIVDDLLDNTEGTGKSKGKDIAQNKLTYLRFFSPEQAQERADDETRQAFNLIAPYVDGPSLLEEYTRTLVNRKT